MWHEILFRVLSIINYIVLIIIAVPIVLQVMFILLGFLPKRSGKRAVRRDESPTSSPRITKRTSSTAPSRRSLTGRSIPRTV